MWTPIVLVGLASLIVILGAFLIGALRFLSSMKNKHETTLVQAETRKQEGIRILRQAQSSEQSKLLSLRLTYGDAAQNKVTSQRLPKIEKLISDTQGNIGERDKLIELLESINPKGNITSTYLIELESILGTAEQMRLRSELDRDFVERLASEVQHIVSRSSTRGDRDP